MDSKISKVIAAMVVAAFCVTAFAVIFTSDDSSADGTVTQKMYVEMVGADGLYTDSQWLIFEFDGTADDFVAKANAELARVGLSKLVFTHAEGSDYISGKYDGSGNMATYFEKDGNWTKTNKTTNTTNTLVGFRLSGFFSHSSSGLFADGREPYMIKDSALARVSKSPLVFDQTAGVNYSTYYLHKNSFEQVGRIPNIGGNALYLEGGLDFRLSKRTSLKINGEFTYSFGKNS